MCSAWSYLRCVESCRALLIHLSWAMQLHRRTSVFVSFLPLVRSRRGENLRQPDKKWSDGNPTLSVDAGWTRMFGSRTSQRSLCPHSAEWKPARRFWLSDLAINHKFAGAVQNACCRAKRAHHAQYGPLSNSCSTRCTHTSSHLKLHALQALLLTQISYSVRPTKMSI